MSQNLSNPLEEVCRSLLLSVGEDPGREGLLRTPARYARAFQELTSGYSQSLEEVVGNGIFHEKCSEMVVVKRIEFYSMCEHHLLPFFGHAHVAYIPSGKILGLSKIPRIVQMFARRLQLQERMTEQIADAINELLQPTGVACVIDAQHLCMMMRGVQVQSSSTSTSALRGAFQRHAPTRSEFMNIIRAE